MTGFVENEISKNAAGGTEIISRHLQKILPPELTADFQIIPSRVRDLAADKIRIVFFNDLPNDPEVQKFKDASYRAKFHHFVFISNWQYQAYQAVLGFPYDSTCSVIEVGFEPLEADWEGKKAAEKTNFVYTSTPQRGLELLVPVFDQLTKQVPNIHLDVFSSFQIYGWPDSDKQFEPLYEEIRNHPNMTYHGFQPNEVVRKHLSTAHVFAYPCTWMETSCRAMEEAMSAGLICVHPNYGALPETSGGMNIMYQGDKDPQQHANIFGFNLLNAISLLKQGNAEDYLHFVKAYTDNRYNIEKIKFQWTNLLQGLKIKFPPEQRTVSTDDTIIFDTNKLFK